MSKTSPSTTVIPPSRSARKIAPVIRAKAARKAGRTDNREDRPLPSDAQSPRRSSPGEMQLGLLLFSRFTVYFDEVVRHGSIRRASEHLLISPSAIDRHILNMEESLGITLFERLPRGLRLTAAGEILIGHIRNCRKELRHAQAQIEDLRGSRRGSVTLVVVEGMTGFIADALAAFHVEYPGVCQQFRTASSDRVCKLVADGSADIGITFNSVIPGNLRVERTLVDQMGALIPVGHPLARADDVSLSQCAEYKIIAPDETMAVYLPLQTVWERTVGGSITGSYQAGSMEMVKSLVGAGAGIGFATALDMRGASAGHKFRFLPLRERNVPLSVLSLVRHSSRSLSSAATLLAAHLARFMRAQEGPGVG